MHQKHSSRADFYRHLSFAAVGGFFGGYAILARCGVLASAQTMNLLEMVMDALHGKGGSALLHLLCLVIYFLGTMSICGGFARRWTPWRRWPWAFSRRICR